MALEFGRVAAPPSYAGIFDAYAKMRSMDSPTKSREIRLRSRPTGWPVPDNFELVEVPLPKPGDGEVLVRNTHMSVDPYMRGRMSDAPSYVPPFKLGEAIGGAAVGYVVASRAERLPLGTWLRHDRGWRDYAIVSASKAEPIDINLAPPSAFLGVLGMTGLTAYVGLHEIGGLKPSDVVFISSAAGAVGSVAGQLAKLQGATTIGSAGSDEKVAYLKNELGFDAAFNYKDGNLSKRLRELAPGGIDLYFDNVGGEQLEAALSALNDYGRIVACGMISQYNEAAPAPRNLMNIVRKRLTMRGFIVFDHGSRATDFLRDVAPAVKTGKIKFPESFVDGLENAPQAFIDMLRGGKYVGKVVVRLADERNATKKTSAA
jgi:NADPH-dependent curcumin reductase CurA